MTETGAGELITRPIANRHFVGLRLSDDGRRLSGVVLSAAGLGLNAQVALIGSANIELPEHLSALSPWNESARRSPHDCPAFATEVAEWQASLVAQLLADTSLDPDQVLVIGVDDPGVWHEYPNGQRACITLTDASRLAETTGLSVIDAFSARDLAQGGGGGPLWPIPLLLLFGNEIGRFGGGPWAVVELGQAVHIYCFSAPIAANDPRFSFHAVQPGLELLDMLVAELTSGQEQFDAGGRWAVQGRKIESLIEDWSQLEVFINPPAWSPRWSGGKQFLITLQQSAHSRRPLQDVLCSATHLAAEGICRALGRAHPNPTEVGAGMIIGRGRQNGMLLRELGVRLPGLTWHSPADFGIDDGAVRAAMVAILGLLHVDHVPANLPEITGAETPRVLGRLTPGTPRHWRRLLGEMAANRPQMMTLRYAI